MRTVAIVGLAESTREALRDSQADEIWTLNWAYKYDFIPRIDRLFEMHPVWLMGKSKKPEHRKMYDHWRWLKRKTARGYPVYMLQDIPRVPGCVRYPIEAVTADLFGGALRRGGQPSDFYGSSVDYMLALAIHEQFDVIETYGVEMGSLTEYRYQRESCAFFIGLALGRGITVKLPGASILLRGKRYGYEGGQMIFRQDLERMLVDFENKRSQALARLQHAEGLLEAAMNSGDPDQVETARVNVNKHRDEVLIASGGYQVLVYQIREIDLEEPTWELENPLSKIET
jgi:hypothetical protein